MNLLKRRSMGSRSANQDFVNVEAEDGQASYMTVAVGAVDVANVGVLSVVGDFFPVHENSRLPIGPIYVRGYTIPKPTRSGILLAPVDIKGGNPADAITLDWWGRLLTDYEATRVEHQKSAQLEALWRHCQHNFLWLRIQLHNDHLQSEAFFDDDAYKERAEDLLRDSRVPYKAEKLYSDDTPRGLQEHVFLERIAHGAQPIGPPESAILWRRRAHLAASRPHALRAFVESIDWTDEERANNALVLIGHDWIAPSLFAWLGALHRAQSAQVPGDYRPQLLEALTAILQRRVDADCASLVEELMVRELSSDRLNLPRRFFVGSRVAWADQLVAIADQVRQRTDASRQQRTAILRDALAQVRIQGSLPFYCQFTASLKDVDDAYNRDSRQADASDGHKDSEVIAIAAERSVVFKSNAMPVRVSLVQASDYGEKLVLVKSGEDIGNDLWVMAIFDNVRELWRRNGLPSLAENLVTYGVYVCGINGGLIEYIPSASLTNVLEVNNGSLFPANIALTRKSVHDAFVASCAGYTLLTYVLGVGDRHLDNLLLTSEGRLFHVDYAYLFGDDPKPFAPPIKLCREMLEAIGPEHLDRFKKLIAAGLAVLQRHPDAILTPVGIGFGDPAKQFCLQRLYSITPKRTTEYNLKTVSDLIDDAASALMPQVLETLHKWAQYWKE